MTSSRPLQLPLDLVGQCKKSAEGVPSCRNAVIMDLEEVRKQMLNSDLVEEEGLPSKCLKDCGWNLNEGSADVDPSITRRCDIETCTDILSA